MLISDLFNAAGSLSLFVCTLLCVLSVRQSRGRRKLQAYKQMLFTRVVNW